MNHRPRRGVPGPAVAPGAVRIVGGRWRGTRLAVTGAPGLRPTSDRVRETLFNWLMPALPGARVLDLFAGSGALGFEAVSRGAASAVLVEQHPTAAAALRETVTRLGAQERIEVVQGDALRWLAAQPPAAFHIAFVDPPFADGLWQDALTGLLPRLAGDAWLYLESPPAQAPVLPPDWPLHRELVTAQARAALHRGPGRRGADTLADADPAP
ncbi:16S rRNA (guanine(966)-N(2))-methyltransferase RsmD [Xanthomonas sp. XNM01]|uniref:16S rRNA (guanine(966)-N(2))-methyltransferase RsmD n=1 Tax=Xanthomonas sp. XNM01 TaxID=2769289 RepID=UPI00178074C9|nr:16S rRNA (guanine(966)-N(2))-methyltransferase RsmD [Xanthomonas sp. XNM01]MBD9367880.1 16S rRNA (guanine(966)-N(2))-methyltransferase RsmD [Xanthomonas sp. XNM01]